MRKGSVLPPEIMHFADPLFLLLLLLLPPLLWYREHMRKKRRGALRFSDLARFRKIRPSRSLKIRHTVAALRLLGLALLIIAAARPQSTESELQNDYTEGVDILIALDCSGSMQAMDLDLRKRSRLDVAKEITGDFIKKRTTDRIGLVVFAGDAYTQCPMTLDYGVLLTILDSTSLTMNGTIPDGTAIGLATARCVKRLQNSEAKSKVIVLLTDGMNNAGEIDPLQAANIAKIQGVKLYTIGTGSRSGVAPVWVENPLFGGSWQNVPVDLDEKSLSEMAEMTKGRYFRAGDAKELRGIFDEIDQLERTKFEDLGEHRYRELFVWFAALALASFLFEITLSQTVYRVLP
jgi:Ca-activated chloride channel family protein